MTDALFGIDYRDSAGALAHVTPADIKSFQGGASFVIEYIGVAAGQGNNALTAANASALESAGLSIVSVYENRPLSGGGMSDTDPNGHYTSAWVDYFSQAGRGTTDAQAAISGAISAGQSTGAIYFAIDLDPAKSTDATTGLNRISETAALNLIDQYFQEISAYFNSYNQLHGTSYQIGVYGAGDTLSKIASDPLVMSDGSHALTWLAGASSWAGSSTFTTWDIKQYDNDQFQLDGRNVDLDQSSGLDFGAWGPTLNNAAAIHDVYMSVLQRPATTAEQNYWIAQDASIGNAAVIADIVSLPEAQTNVYPVLQAFQLAFGHFPTAGTLDSIVSTGLTETQFSNAFVSDQTFANLYLPAGSNVVEQGGLYYEGGIQNAVVQGGITYQPLSDLPIVAGGVGESVIKGYYETGLGHLPTPTTLAGFDGLTIGQAFLAFIQSQADLASLRSSIVSYLTTAADNASGIQSIVGSADVNHGAVAHA